MKKIAVLAVIIMWAACGYLNWGLTLGHFTHEFPDASNVGISGNMAVAGPFATPVVLLMSQPYHWQLKPLTTEQRWEAFQKQFPELDRDYFEHNYD